MGEGEVGGGEGGDHYLLGSAGLRLKSYTQFQECYQVLDHGADNRGDRREETDPVVFSDPARQARQNRRRKASWLPDGARAFVVVPEGGEGGRKSPSGMGSPSGAPPLCPGAFLPGECARSLLDEVHKTLPTSA